MKRLLAALAECHITTYRINSTRTESVELFFVKQQLQVRRTKDVVHVDVTVFRDVERDGTVLRGCSVARLTPGMAEEELCQKLLDAHEAAQYAANPMYAMYEGECLPEVAMSSGFAGMTLREGAETMAAALFRADTAEDAFLNSAEIFMEREHVRILTSGGTDVGYVRYNCNGEFVTQCRAPQDVEQHYAFRYAEPDTAALTEKVRAGLSAARDRAGATENPKAGQYDLVLSGEQLETLLSLYRDRASAGMVYAHYSDYAVGMAVQGENVTGEKLNITLLPDAPFSNEGIPMQELPLLRDGMLTALHGNTRFCRYLGTEPVGEYERFRLTAGTAPFDTLKRGCLYPVSFSDFQMNPLTGRFGGEIRLAYLFMEDGVRVLTGGSVNGSLLEKQDSLTFSREQYRSATYEGPFAIRLCGVSVSGC